MLEALRELGLFTSPGAHTLPEVLAAGRIAPAHHRLVRRWLAALTSGGMLRQDPATAAYALARPAGPERLERGWERLGELALAGGDGSRLLEYFRASARALPELLRGDQDPVRLLFPAGGLDVSDALHRDSLVSAWTNRVVATIVDDLLTRRAGAAPARVLEVGAGVGGSSSGAIDALAGRGADYLFTDLSRFFLNAAQQRFSGRPGVRFGVFDLDEDPRGQGLAANSFDLILAGDVLHASRDVDRAVGRLRELLAPGGWLVFVEMTREHPQIMTSLELMIRLDASLGDFADERRGRDQTFLTRAQWEEVVARAGGEVALVLPDSGDLMAEVGMHVVAARFKASRARVDPEELTAHLAGLLPEYMVPAHLEVVDSLPLTANGKVDRGTLRRWLGARSEPAAAGGAEPAGDLERRLAAVWAEVLAVGSVGRDRDFFSLGGDSLLAAQLVGRLRETVPEAASVFFDDLLRRVLTGPTVAGLAASLALPEADEAAPAAAAGSPLVVIDERGTGLPFVLVHGADGTLDAHRALVGALAGAVPLVGLVAGDMGEYAAQDPSILVQRTAARCAAALLDHGYARVHLAGHGFGAVLACEVARHLGDSGGEVESLTVISGLAPGEERRRTPAGAEVAGRSLAAAAAHQPDAYAGDLTLLRPLEEEPGVLESMADHWRAVCLGDVRVMDVPGAHATCLSPPHVGAVAELLVAAGRGLRGTP
jgi:pyochelin synthetase